MDVIDWLLDSDPAVRWQVLRDLTDADPAAIATERARVLREGLGARSLPTRAKAAPGTGRTSRTGRRPSTPRASCRPPAPIRATPVDASMTRVANGFRWHVELGGKTFFEGERALRVLRWYEAGRTS